MCLVLACGILLSLVSFFRSSRSPVPQSAYHDDTVAITPATHERDASNAVAQQTHQDTPSTPAEEELKSLMTAAPALTLIVLWSPHERNEDYLPTFFASIGANPSIDLLLIKFDKYGHSNGECERPQAPGVANVREVCIAVREYVALHVKYLCDMWRCDEKQTEIVAALVEERIPLDRVRSARNICASDVLTLMAHRSTRCTAPSARLYSNSF